MADNITIDQLNIELTADSKKATSAIEELASTLEKLKSSLAPIANVNLKVSNSFNTTTKNITKAAKATDDYAKKANSAGKSAQSFAQKMAQKISTTRTIVSVFQNAANKMADWFNESNEYIETVNLFKVTMDDAAGEAQNFAEKVSDFFSDSEKFFSQDDTKERVFIWHQGESDSSMSYNSYKDSLKQLYKMTKKLGFTKFFICRVGYWGNNNIANIMRAQEDFCNEEKDAFMITRVASFFEYPNQNIENWFCTPIEENFKLCRDSFLGYSNNHINEKGFQIMAKHAALNAIRIIFDRTEPILEQERIIPLLNTKQKY